MSADDLSLSELNDRVEEVGRSIAWYLSAIFEKRPTLRDDEIAELRDRVARMNHWQDAAERLAGFDQRPPTGYDAPVVGSAVPVAEVRS